MEMHNLIKYFVEVFNKLEIEYFITGSIASIYYGEPRFTNDIDIVADIHEQHIEKLLNAFPSEEFYVSREAILEALLYNKQFNIIQTASGLKIDVIIRKKNTFDDNRFKRVKKLKPAENIEAKFASPEDVIIMKMKYYKEGGSEKHLRDITGILKISAPEIDRKYIEDWVSKFGLEDIWNIIISKTEIK